MATLSAVLAHAEAALDEFYRANKALFRLARAQADELAARDRDDDDWRRLPSGRDRCPVSGLSRSSIYRLIKAGSVRTRSIHGAAYYSAGDILNTLATA